MESPAGPSAAPAAVPATPASPTPPVTQPATHAAVATNDTNAYRAARRAERVGKPLPAVTVTPEAKVEAIPASPAPPPAAPATPASPEPPAVSKRQQQINDYERRIAESQERIRALEAQLAPPATPATPPAAPVKGEPEWKRYAGMPDAPKLEEFDSVPEHTAAMATFIAREMLKADRAEAQTRADRESLTAAQAARVDKFVAQLDASQVSDPTFASKLSADVRALEPFDALKPGQLGGPRNVIAEQIYDSPIAPKVLLHLSQHPEALAALETMPAHIAALPIAGNVRAKAHIQHIVRAYGKLEASLEAPSAPPVPEPQTLTAAPSITSPVGSRPHEPADPVATAIRTNNTSAYRQLRREQRVAAMKH